jgi:hypothetical protein
MAIESFDVGNLVQCDGCGKVYRTADDSVNLPDSGGFLWGRSTVRCPECGPKFEESARGFGEEHLITARCPEGTSFADWVLQLRGGNNKVTFYTDEDAFPK